MTRGIKELGDTQRCSKCNEFMKMIGLKISATKVRALYLCDKCIKNSQEDYSIEEFVKMGNGFLLDEKWIKDFQRKYMIATNEFIQIKGGLDGAYFSNNKEATNKYGKKLICKCGEFYKLSYVKKKKDKLYFEMHCNECGSKKLKIEKDAFFELGRAGIIPTSVITTVKDEIEMEEMDWTSADSYATPSTVLSSDARGRLGMEDDDSLEELEDLLCPKCGMALNVEMKKYGKCPQCGEKLN